MKNLCIYTLLLAVSLISSLADARWANFSEAPYAVNFENIQVKVKKDGTSVGTYESQIEILKESARGDQGMQRLTYNEFAGNIKIIEAKTINGKTVIPVAKKNIERKPLASSGQGFDTTTQISIPFPAVNVGSKLYLKYERTVTRPTLPGFFYATFAEGLREYVQKFDFKYESEMPLYWEVNDPENKYINVTHTQNMVHFTSKAPIYQAYIEEDNALYSSQSLLWIGVTSAKDWSAIPKSTIQSYDDTINSKLPEKFAEILKQAQTKKEDVEQINTVTSLLADKIRYVGDWRTVRGAFHPHSLSFIAKQGYGDCKDFTVATGSILKRLGFDVQAAWVYRGSDAIISPLKIATPQINHAIVYAKKNGKEYWIDGTNTASFAQGIFDDIADRPAIILDPTGAHLNRTRAIQAADGFMKVILNLDFSGKDIIKGKGEVNLTGTTSVTMTAAELSSEKKALDYSLVTWSTNRRNLLNWNFDDYSLKSRTVADLKTKFDYQEPWLPLLTSSGKGYSIPAISYVSFFQGKSQDRVTALNLPFPVRKQQEYVIKGREVQLPSNLDCQGNSDWAEYSRSISKKSDAIVVSDNFVLKVRTIPPEVIGSKEFSLFQNKLVSCMQDAVIVFKDR